MIKRALAGLGVIGWIFLQTGCAEVIVTGTVAGTAEFCRYTATNTAKETLVGNTSHVVAASKRALKKMNVRLHSVSSEDSKITVTGSTAELDIIITIEPITATTTKVFVNAVKDRVIKDRATAAEIVSQIRIEVEEGHSPEKALSKVFIKNDCNRPIRVAVHYLAGTGELRTWQTQGWFALDPGQRKHVVDTRNRYIYFYGETRSEDKICWAGEVLRRFEGIPYGFFKADSGTAKANYTQSFRCE